MGRNIGLKEFVDLTASELRMRPEEFWDDRFGRIAKRSLDRPTARRQTRTGQRGEQLYPKPQDKAVALVGSLLELPPIPEYAGRVAMAAVEELLRRERARWIPPRGDTILRFEQFSRKGDFDARLVRSSIAALDNEDRAAGSLVKDNASLVGVYLGGPLRELRAPPQLDGLHEEMESELGSLEAELEGRLRFRLFHPGHDVEVDDDQDLWEWGLGLLEEKVAVLIVAEIGESTIGFGGACEIGHFRRLPGEAAHLLSPECAARSDYLPGYSRDLGIEMMSFTRLEEIPKLARGYLRSRTEEIADTVRRREDAIELAAPTHRAVVSRWPTLPRVQQEEVLDAADLTETAMIRALERPSAFAALSSFSRQRLVDNVLGIEEDSTPATREAEAIHVDLLLRIANGAGWSTEEARIMLEEASRRTANMDAAATRYTYITPERWHDLHDELFDN